MMWPFLQFSLFIKGNSFFTKSSLNTTLKPTCLYENIHQLAHWLNCVETLWVKVSDLLLCGSFCGILFGNPILVTKNIRQSYKLINLKLSIAKIKSEVCPSKQFRINFESGNYLTTEFFYIARKDNLRFNFNSTWI